MENIMMLPASYCVMNEEEMTYTSGGANIVQAAAAFYGLGCTFWTVSSCFTGVGLLINALVIFS